MKKKKTKKKFKIDSIDVVLCGILIAIVTYTFVLSSSKVSGSSMEPNFHNDEYVSILKHTPLSNFSRFDLVVVKVKNDILLNEGEDSSVSSVSKTKDSTYIFKRIIGVAGDKVEYRNNELSINGSVIKENFLPKGDATYYTKDTSTNNIKYYIEENGVTVEKFAVDGVIPKDYYFVMGDNRNNSKDSRYIGLVHKSQLIGEVKFVLYPWKNFGTKEINEAK